MSDYGGGVDSSLSGSRPDSLPSIQAFIDSHLGRFRALARNGPAGPARLIGGIEDFKDYWAAGKADYDPAKITVPTLLVQAEWDRDLPPYMAQTLFPLLVNAPDKRYVMLAEGTHTIVMEKNRLQLFATVQAFLDEAGRT
jgi:alpha-beta hydrolase superfamily lysophospholipase